MSDDLASAWGLDPSIAYLNHGSFGACPRAVLTHQRGLQDLMEAEAVTFLVRELEDRLDAARGVLGAFLGAHAEDLAFVPNATAGVNTVLRSLALSGALSSGSEVLVTDHEYNATRNALDVAAGSAGARVVVVRIPFPLASEDDAFEAVLGAVTRSTHLLVIDHVTSPTGLVLPVERIVRALRERGVETLVDGAHAPGMLALDLDALGAGYYTGNCHKWTCSPKGSAFLHVRRDLQAGIRPLAISHGANSGRSDRSRFLIEADWTGTTDPTPWLSIPKAIEVMGSLLPGGWPALRSRNRALTLQAQGLLSEALGVERPAPESMIGSLAAVPLPPGRVPPDHRTGIDDLQDALLLEHRIEVPVMPWPVWPARLLRVSAQAYNSIEQYQRLAQVLPSLT